MHRIATALVPHALPAPSPGSRERRERGGPAACSGTCGYLLEDTPAERLVAAIREQVSGGSPMSPEIARKVVSMFSRVAPSSSDSTALSQQEPELLKLLAAGHSYKTAAHGLGVAIDTVRFHVRNVYERLHVHSESEAVVAATRRGPVR